MPMLTIFFADANDDADANADANNLFSPMPMLIFLDASSHLYKRLCPSIGLSIHRSIHLSVHPSTKRQRERDRDGCI